MALSAGICQKSYAAVGIESREGMPREGLHSVQALPCRAPGFARGGQGEGE
jgi:hypothetical protein